MTLLEIQRLRSGLNRIAILTGRATTLLLHSEGLRMRALILSDPAMTARASRAAALSHRAHIKTFRTIGYLESYTDAPPTR